MNKVWNMPKDLAAIFSKEGVIPPEACKDLGAPLTPRQLADAANAISKNKPFTAWDFSPENPDNRIEGKGHCDCFGNGEFLLLPEDDPDVLAGQKRYMVCIKCGCFSHL